MIYNSLRLLKQKTAKIENDNLTFRKSNQIISKIDGKIQTTKNGTRLRIFTFILLISLIFLYNYFGYLNPQEQPIMIYTSFVIVFSILIFFFGWNKYRNPVLNPTELKNKEYHKQELVSIIIPVYNQEKLIRSVINSIFNSTYKKIEVIVVDDGSIDNTLKILNTLKIQKYNDLKIFSQKNSGKRKAVARGFMESSGRYVILVDSDSIIDKNAINEIVKTFDTDNKIGAIAGHAKISNSDKNLLTRCQDAWYDYEFNIYKACESFFGFVTCCSGCLAAYRREAVNDVLSYWNNSYVYSSNLSNNENKTQTIILESKNQHRSLYYNRIKKYLFSRLLKIRNKLLFSLLNYDDSEDRALTTYCLMRWKSVYLASALVYTDVPETFSGYIQQQKRWKKGYLRANIFASTFMWSRSKNPLMSLFFYTGLILTIISPILTITALFYGMFVLNELWAPISLIGGFLIVGFIEGLDYKMRDSNSVNWKYRPLINLILSFVISWLVFYAIFGYKKNVWLTR